MPVVLKNRIPEIMAELPVRGKAMALTLAEETATAGRDRAPVATGTLRDSIEAKSSPGGAAVYATWYWFLVEFGSTNAPANPFMIPALEAAYTTVLRVAREELAAL